MYRLSQTTNIALLALLLFQFGCGGERPEVKDPAHVETLRLRITKVRNAIEETRSTITLSRGADYLPELYVRLAELLSEEAKYHYQLAFEREQRSSRTLHVPQVRVLKEQAIEMYKSTLERFPDSKLGARILFNIGHEYRELGEFEEMRKAFKRVVDEYPKSPLRDDALLVLGDDHFDRAELKKAKTYYEEIARSDLGDMTGLALYKLGWVWVNLEECDEALESFHNAIVKSEEWEAIADGSGGEVAGQDVDVRREALVDMARCYSRERKPKTAVPYIKKMSYNRATYVAALARFSSRYRLTNQYEGVIPVTRELLLLGSGTEDRVNDAIALITALKQSKEYSRIGEDIALVVSAFNKRLNRIELGDDQRERMAEEFEVYVRDLLTSAQGELGEQDKDAALALAEGYRVYVETFPESSERGPMLLNMADVLGIAGRDFEAGLRYNEAANFLADRTELSNAYYDAIVQFQKSLDREDDRSGLERVMARAALRRAAQRLLPLGLEEDRLERVKFAIAQSYYDAGRYEKAIDHLTAVAYELPQSEKADLALNMVLDSFNSINDYDGLMYAARRFMAADSPASPGLRQELEPIVLAAEQRKLDELSLEAAGDEGGDLAVLEQFAVQNEGTDLGERALLNAFIAARAVGDSEKLYKLAEQLKQSYPESEQLPGIYATVAQTAAARFEYDQAIASLQEAAEVSPEQKTRLLMATGELYEQLGDYTGAEAAYSNALSSAEGGAQVAVLDALARIIELENQPSKLMSKLSSYSDSGASELSARMGLAYLAAGQAFEAESVLQSALEDPAASMDAQARAKLGMAEVLYDTFLNYPAPDDLELLQEYILLVEVVEEEYMTAIREGGPEFMAIGLARFAAVAQESARRLESLTLPAELSTDERSAVRDALGQRADALRATSEQALEICAQQAIASRLLSPAVRSCIQGQPLTGDLVTYDVIRARGASTLPSGLSDYQQRISKNPSDVDSLREIGVAFLDNGDPHIARLAFARAVQAGGGAEEQNLLGIACVEVGDLTGAWEAFSAAAAGGLEAGRQNLVSVLKDNGLANFVEKVLEQYPEGSEGGRLLGR